MTHASHNRTVQRIADIVAAVAVRAAAKPCNSPAHRRELVELLLFIAAEIETLKVEGAYSRGID